MRNFYQKVGKRFFDILLSSIALVILAPLLLVLSLMIRVNLGSPVLFTQDRPGRDGKLFTLYKFRTMTDKRDSQGNLVDDSIRLTRFGKILRATSLDELPELWNILKGDMSLVGPRPLLIEYLALYNEHQKRRHEVRPGLTGYAQVNGRNTVDWPKRFDMDVWYVEHVSFILDMRIILSTIKKVLFREGISSDTSATMEPFKGNEYE